MLGFVTDKGNVRELNEDFLSYSREDEFSIYVVGDGMGGHNAGEVASKRAVESIICFVKENFGVIPLDNLLKDAIALMKLTPTDESNIELNVEELVHKYNFDGYLIEKTRPLYIYLKSHSEKYVMVGENYEAAYFRLRP